ncbi:MAG: nucleotidyltransferase domain-containing protein [Candidatus Thorarchaeota archaeon]
MPVQAETLELFNSTLDDFIERVEQDSNIITAILFGSLVSGNVWEESDIDLILISKDASRPYKLFWLVDGDVLIQVGIQSRQSFRQSVERALTSSQTSHILSTGKILFSKDETLTKYIEDAHRIGERDKQLQLMRLALHIPGDLSKVKKSLVVYDDFLMAFRFLIHAIENVARVDLVLNDQIPGREFLQQALECNPTLFKKIYSDLLIQGITTESVEEVLQIITKYLEEKSLDLYSPVLEFISEEGGHVGSTLVDDYFQKRFRLAPDATLITILEWLADQGIIQRMPKPIRLTSRSREPEMEAAYYYSEEELL